MFVALGENGSRIDICQATKEGKYYCPICHGELIVKEGEINVKHFSHTKRNCTDNWKHDMSEWHRTMQSRFQLPNREVVIEHEGKIHRADILVGNTVIEFQKSPISTKEFTDRNIFFKSAGYRIAWVFNVNEPYHDEKLEYIGDSDRRLYAWKHPLKVFKASEPLSDWNKDFTVWFYWSNEFGERFNKVKWTARDDDGCPSMKRIIFSNHTLSQITENEIDLLFDTEKAFFYKALDELNKTHRFSLKYMGVPNKKREDYICPLRPEAFGITLYGERGCSYCRYCYMIAHEQRYDKQKHFIYCCYPNQARPFEEMHPGYDCSKATEYNI